MFFVYLKRQSEKMIGFFMMFNYKTLSIMKHRWSVHINRNIYFFRYKVLL